MKAILRTTSSIFLLFLSVQLNAQCTQAQMNWDNLDYYYHSSGNKPYGAFVSVAQAQAQKFAIGTTYVTVTTPAIANFINGENATHSGELTVGGVLYTGEDAQFNASINGQEILLAFGTAVNDVYFTLYDVDMNSEVYITAEDAFGFPKIINATFQSPTILTDLNGLLPTNNTTQLIVTANGTNVPNTSNEGSVTVFISGAVRNVRVNINNNGTDPTFWLSDITACVSGSFPVNYHQMASNMPYTGQPDYFISTPDNASAYMVGSDVFAGTANYLATRLFTDSTRFINSLAYDGVNRILYYVLDATIAGTQNANNKQIKKYDFNTETSSMVIADISWLGIPTFEAGVESAGACFYDGALYLGIEGGHHDDDAGSGTTYTSTREATVYKIEFDASRNPVNAYQVYSLNHYDPASWTNSYNDWGDLIIKDGILYNFNTARQGSGPVTYPNSAIHKFNMMSGSATRTANPTPASPYIGQVAMDWAGTMYSVRTGVQSYNITTNVLGTNRTIAAASGSGSFPIPQGAGDASEPFRPKVDVGDAPASFDPDPLAPALHDFAENTVRFGTVIDREWVKSASTNADSDGADEDGVATVNIFSSGTNYTVNINVFNNPATLDSAIVCAWLDFNMNGTFEASEGVTRTVRKQSTMQSITLSWPVSSFSIPDYSWTYMRIRVASKYTDATRRLTTAKPTGYMPNGEVEDYYVLTTTWPLPLASMQFQAKKHRETVQLDWSFEGDHNIDRYTVSRSADGQNFETIAEVKSNGGKQYKVIDKAPLEGTSYYRIQATDKQGKSETGPIRSISFEATRKMRIYPNPSIGATSITLSTITEAQATVSVYNAYGLGVRVHSVRLKKGHNEIPLSTQQIPPGSYIVEVRTDAFTERMKLIIKK